MDLQKYEQVVFLEEKSPAICNESPEISVFLWGICSLTGKGQVSII